LLAIFAIFGHIATWPLREMDGFGPPEKEDELDDESEDINLITNPHHQRQVSTYVLQCIRGRPCIPD